MDPTASTGTLVLVASVGGLGAFLGAAVGQLVQLYRDKRQHERELELRDRDHARTLESARRDRQHDRYVELLGSLARYETALAELEGLLASWLDFVTVIESNTDPEMLDSARAGWRSLPVWGDAIFDLYDAARDDVVDKINAAVPVASAQARRLFERLEIHPPAGLLRVRVTDESLMDGTGLTTVPKVVAQLADVPSAIRLADQLRDVCTEADGQLRRELALD